VYGTLTPVLAPDASDTDVGLGALQVTKPEQLWARVNVTVVDPVF
jgi:hypothetical protein